MVTLALFGFSRLSMLSRRIAVILAALLIAFGGGALAATQTPSASSAQSPQNLQPQPREVLIARTAVEILQHRHFPSRTLDASFAREILNQYYQALDPSKFFFTQAQIDHFNKLAKELPHDLRNGDMEPAYAIYRVYAKEVAAHIQYALKLLKHEPKFNQKIDFRFAREHAKWAKDAKSLNELWQKRVKNDILTLLLTGKNWKDTVKILKKRYEYALHDADQVTSEDVFSQFMDAYTQALDPHSSYFSPFQAQEFRIEMSLKLQGIGAQLTDRNGYVTIVRIIPGGPAAKSGELHPGDRITAVGQGKKGKMTDVVGWRLDDVVKKIRGHKGSTVRLSILPAGAVPGSAQHTISLVRNTIQLKAQRAHSHLITTTVDGKKYKLGVIKIPSFYVDFHQLESGDKHYRSVTHDVRRLVAKLKKQHVDGILLDLRNNGGGSLEEATALTGLFIPHGPVVQIKNDNGQIQVLKSPEHHVEYSGPLAVMVNRFSASATEIFTAALKDYHRALILGSRTWGKGTVQTLINLKNYLPGFKPGELKVTIAQFYRVTGASTQRRGVKPEIQFPSAINDKEFGETSYSNALPWNAVKPANYTPLKDGINANLKTLQTYYDHVIANEPKFSLYLKQVAHERKANNRKSVSLDMAVRKAERKTRRAYELKMGNAWLKLSGKKPVKSLAAYNKLNFSPPDMEEKAAAALLGDLIRVDKSFSKS